MNGGWEMIEKFMICFWMQLKKEPQLIDHMVTHDVVCEFIFVLSFLPNLLCTYRYSSYIRLRSIE